MSELLRYNYPNRFLNFWDRFLSSQEGFSLMKLSIPLVLLLFILVPQLVQPFYVSFDLAGPLYSLLLGSFFIHFSCLTYLRDFKWAKYLSHFYESFLVIGFMSFLASYHGILGLFLLANIIFCGIYFSSLKTYTLALWTSCLFSLFLITSEAQVSWFFLTVNNGVFLLTSFLSLNVSSQFKTLKTELISQQEDLVALDILNRMIVEHVSAGLMALNHCQQVTHWNKNLEDILGFSRLYKRNLLSLFPELAKRLQKVSKDSLSESVSHQMELDWRDRVSKKRKTLQATITFVPGQKNHNKFSILLFQDVTERKKEEKVRLQKEKMEAVGKLAAGIAHEIRNPLASISGSLQMISLGKNSLGEDNEKLLGIMSKEVKRLNCLVGDFLEFVRPGVLELQEVRVSDLISDVEKIVQLHPKLSKKVDFKKEVKSTQNILIDYDKMKQVLLNLIINAYEALVDTPKPFVRLQCFDHEGRVVICVRDNGCGMSEETLDRVYEPFYTTKSKGTGLGMAIVHKIIEDHKAGFHLESSREGTIFEIYLIGENTPQSMRQGA